MLQSAFKDPSKSRHYKLLLSAAALFTELKIEPAAWCSFSACVWASQEETEGEEKAKNTRPEVPPVAWVFSPQRIRERENWFRNQGSSCEGGRIIFPDSTKKLIQRQTDLHYAFRVRNPQDDAGTLALVREYFSPGEFEKMFFKAQRDAKRRQEEITAEVAQGGWVWR